MRRTTLLIAALATAATIATATPALAMRDPGPNAMYGPVPGVGQTQPGGQYTDGMNLYEYVRSSPPGFVDWNGAQATRPSTQPTTTQAMNDWWGKAADAVNESKWVTAASNMSKAYSRRAQVGPTGGKPCCCKGEDAKKCHIIITHLAKMETFFEADKDYTAEEVGWPFPDRDRKPMTFRYKMPTAAVGIITRVQLKHEDNKDTTGCWLKGDLIDYTMNTDHEVSGGGPKHDIGTHPFWKGVLNTSVASNWYIDTPIGFTSDPFRARYFNMSVSVLDENRNAIDGITANYGWAYKIDINKKAWAQSKVSWKAWPSRIGVPHSDPKFKPDSSFIGALRREWGL